MDVKYKFKTALTHKKSVLSVTAVIYLLVVEARADAS